MASLANGVGVGRDHSYSFLMLPLEQNCGPMVKYNYISFALFGLEKDKSLNGGINNKNSHAVLLINGLKRYTYMYTPFQEGPVTLACLA